MKQIVKLSRLTVVVFGLMTMIAAVSFGRFDGGSSSHLPPPRLQDLQMDGSYHYPSGVVLSASKVFYFTDNVTYTPTVNGDGSYTYVATGDTLQADLGVRWSDSTVHYYQE